jgi:hypothetical protein
MKLTSTEFFLCTPFASPLLQGVYAAVIFVSAPVLASFTSSVFGAWETLDLVP